MVYSAPFRTEKGQDKTMQKNSSSKTKKKPIREWRKNKNKWTDTLFEQKLLTNPSLMSNIELAKAMKEFQEWTKAIGKYDWNEDPFKEGKEDECPFSSAVWSRIMNEAIVRLHLIGELSIGRFKNHA